MPFGFLSTMRAGIDLGTANILVFVQGQGIVVNEPSVVARHNRDNALVAVGAEARMMQGRTPGALSIIRPMREGVIADYLTTEAMLRYFIGLVSGRFSLVRPEIMVTVPVGITSVEQRAVRDAAEQAGARRPAHLVPEPLAAALGAGVPVGTARGNMIVNIGGGRTEAAIISLFGIVASESVRVAGDRIDEVVGVCALQLVLEKPIGKLSKGYKQRVGLAQALLHDPEVLIMDEPTAGLDPNQIKQFRENMQRLGRTKTLLISTHILQEVEAVADRVLLIHDGRLVFDGALAELEEGGSIEEPFHRLTREPPEASPPAAAAGAS